MDTCCHVIAAGIMKQREAAIAKIDEDPKLDRYTKIISGKISYPDSFSPVSENLISKLCTKVPSKRLGNMKGEQELRCLQSPPMGSGRWYCRSYSGISIWPYAIDAIDTSKY